MPAYVPPALREKSANTISYTTKQRLPEQGYSIREICRQFDHESFQGTLNGDKEPSYILIFRDQHPEWPSKIFCKSNLSLLPSVPGDQNQTEPPTNPTPSQTTTTAHDSSPSPKSIPVFTQDRLNQKTRRSQYFWFHGTYTITNIQYLELHTDTLVKMLALKFPTSYKRESSDWEKSLATKWAIVELRREEATSSTTANNPMVPLKEVQRKSVNELLEEMRLSGPQKACAKKWADAGEDHLRRRAVGEGVVEGVEGQGRDQEG